MDSIVPVSFSLFTFDSHSSDVLVGVVPIGHSAVLIIYEHSLIHVKDTTLCSRLANAFSLPAPVQRMAQLYSDIVLLQIDSIIYACHVNEERAQPLRVLLEPKQPYSSSNSSCLAASPAGYVALCSLREGQTLVITIYEDECTSEVPILTSRCTIEHCIAAYTFTGSCKLNAFFDPIGLFLVIHIQEPSSTSSYILVLADVGSTYFDATFAKQLNFDDELRAQYKQELLREKPGWVPCSWRKYDQCIQIHGFTADGRFIIATHELSGSVQPSSESADSSQTACCANKGTNGGTNTCKCSSEPSISVPQKFIPYEGRSIALESVEDVTWTPSSYMQAEEDLIWYKKFYGIPYNYADNLTFMANNMSIYPASICFYDPMVLRNPHVVFPMRALSSQRERPALVRGVRIGKNYNVIVLYRCENFYYVDVYASSSYIWRLAAEFVLPCNPSLISMTPTYMTVDARVFCMLSPGILGSLTLQSLIQQSCSGSFSRIQDGMAVYTDLKSFRIPPPAYNCCLMRDSDSLIAVLPFTTLSLQEYVAVLTERKLNIVFVRPFESFSLASEAPALAGDTSFQEQEALMQSDRIVSKVMKENKKAHFKTINDLEDTQQQQGQRNTSFDIITKEELLLDPFRSDTLQAYIPTHVSSTILALDIVDQICEEVTGHILRYKGQLILYPLSLTRDSGEETRDTIDFHLHMLGLTTDEILIKVVLKLTLQVTPVCCMLISATTTVKCERSYSDFLSNSCISLPAFALDVMTRHRFQLSGAAEDRGSNAAPIMGLSDFSSLYYVSQDTSSGLLFTIPSTSSRLLVYSIDLKSNAILHKPIYSCHLEPWTTILYATEFSVTLYVNRGYLDIKCPSRLAYLKTQCVLQKVLTDGAAVTDILELCFKHRLLLSALSLAIDICDSKLHLYFKLLLSSDPIFLLRALEAVVCPHEMKTHTSIVFGRYNTTEAHESRFWAQFVEWMYTNMPFIVESSVRNYKEAEELHTTYLKALLRILQLHAVYHSGLTKAFGYQNKSFQERTFVELVASFTTKYLITASTSEEPSPVTYMTHLASAATSYQMNLVQLLQAIELYLFKEGHYIDTRAVASAMGLPIAATTVSCLNLAEDVFIKCHKSTLLRSYVRLIVASNGFYPISVQTDHDLTTSVFPYVSTQPLKYQLMPLFKYLDLSYCCLSEILRELTQEPDIGAYEKALLGPLRLDNWSSEDVALGALKRIEEVLRSNLALLQEVITKYPLSEYLVRLAAFAAPIGSAVVRSLLDVFACLSTRAGTTAGSTRISSLVASIDMALYLRIGQDGGMHSEAYLLPATKSHIEEIQQRDRSSVGAQELLVQLIFLSLKEGQCSAVAQDMLFDLQDVEPSDALLKTLITLLIHKAVDGLQVLRFLQAKLVKKGVSAAEEKIKTQRGVITELYKQCEAIRAKQSAHADKKEFQKERGSRLQRLEKSIETCKQEVVVLAEAVHNTYEQFEQLMSLCLIVPLI